MISLSGRERIRLHPPLTVSAFLSLAVMNRFGWRSLPLWATAEDWALLILDLGPQFLHMQTICSLIFGVFQPLMSPVYHVWLQHYKHIYYYNPTKWLSLTRSLAKNALKWPHFAGEMLIAVITMFKNTLISIWVGDIFIYIYYHIISCLVLI